MKEPCWQGARAQACKLDVVFNQTDERDHRESTFSLEGMRSCAELCWMKTRLEGEYLPDSGKSECAENLQDVDAWEEYTVMDQYIPRKITALGSNNVASAAI